MTAIGMEVVVFVGLQASGKLTCYRCCFAATHDHISKDAWPNARHRQRRQLRLIDEALAAGHPVVVDTQEGFERVRVARMTTDGTFELHAGGG